MKRTVRDAVADLFPRQTSFPVFAGELVHPAQCNADLRKYQHRVKFQLILTWVLGRMPFSSWAGSGNLIGDDVESFLAEEKAALLTGPGMFSTTDDSLLHSGVRLKSVELIAIPFHTWSQEFTKVKL